MAGEAVGIVDEPFVRSFSVGREGPRCQSSGGVVFISIFSTGDSTALKRAQRASDAILICYREVAKNIIMCKIAFLALLSCVCVCVCGGGKEGQTKERNAKSSHR